MSDLLPVPKHKHVWMVVSTDLTGAGHIQAFCTWEPEENAYGTKRCKAELKTVQEIERRLNEWEQEHGEA